MVVDPIIKGVGGMSEVANTQRKGATRMYLGSVDVLTAANWAKECGAAIGTKEFIAYAKKKMMSGEFAAYQADRPRTHFNGHDLR